MTQMNPGVAAAGSDAATRSALYRLLADSFSFPSPGLYEWLREREYFETLRAMLTALPYAPDAPSVAALEDKLGGITAHFEELCADYIRLFDVGSGRGRPPCTLYGGEYAGRARLDVMEELVRFYGFFDLALSEQDRELPDHLSVELEFLHYLTFREDRALEAGADPSSYRRAQADFIERHPGQWLPVLRGKLETQTPLPFFDGLVAITAEMLRADLGYLRSVLASP